MRLRQLARSEGFQGIRTLEVVILQRRLVDLADEHHFVGRIGLCGVEVLGTFGKHAVQNVLPALGFRIGIIPRRLAAAHHEQQQ